MRSVALTLFLAACASAPPPPVAVTRGAAALSDWRQGYLARAESGYRLALEEDRFTVDVPGAIKHLNNLGTLALYDGRLEEARGCFQRALELCDLEGEVELRRRLCLQLACCLLRGGELERCAAALEELGPWAEASGPGDRTQYRLLRAGLALRSGDRPGANRLAGQALESAATPGERAAAGLMLGRAAGSAPAARGAFTAALEDARQAGELPLVVACLLGLARAAADQDAALRYCELALEAAASRGYEVGRSRALEEIERLRTGREAAAGALPPPPTEQPHDLGNP